MDKKNEPMMKNGLGENLPSENYHVNENKKITTALERPVYNNADTQTAGNMGDSTM